MTATRIEVGDLRPEEAELLFGLAKSTFETTPGWTDERVVAALANDVVLSRARTACRRATSRWRPTQTRAS